MNWYVAQWCRSVEWLLLGERELTWFLMIQKRTNHYPCCCVHSKTYMYHNCRQQGFHKETKKQNSCVKLQENILHLWIKIHLRSLKLSQRILLRLAGKLSFLYCSMIFLVKFTQFEKCKVTTPIGWGTCPFTATPPCPHSTLPSKLLVAILWSFYCFLVLIYADYKREIAMAWSLLWWLLPWWLQEGQLTKLARGKT